MKCDIDIHKLSRPAGRNDEPAEKGHFILAYEFKFLHLVVYKNQLMKICHNDRL